MWRNDHSNDYGSAENYPKLATYQPVDSMAQRCRQNTTKTVSAPQGLGPPPEAPKAGVWNSLMSSSLSHLAFDAGCQLGALVSLHRGLFMWSLWEGFLPAWWPGSQDNSPQGGRSRWKVKYLTEVQHDFHLGSQRQSRSLDQVQEKGRTSLLPLDGSRQDSRRACET